jgi:hypothetical protein
MRAHELDCKRGGCGRIGKIPAKIILVIFSATASKTCFDISLGMKRMHRIELLAEPARRHSYLDEVREFPFKGPRTLARFVARHSFNVPRVASTRNACFPWQPSIEVAGIRPLFSLGIVVSVSESPTIFITESRRLRLQWSSGLNQETV